MALINISREVPAFATLVGAPTSGGGATSYLFQYAATVLSSNLFVKNSNTRMTFLEGGYYEIHISFASAVTTPTVAWNVECGVSGSFTSMGTSDTSSNSRKFGVFSYIISVQAGDYLEFRGTTSGSGFFNSGNSASLALENASIMPSTTIKKI